MRIAAIATVLLSTLLLIGRASGADPRIDGYWWTKQSVDAKFAYVVGFWDGQNYAEQIFDITILLSDRDPTTGKVTVERMRALSEHTKKASELISGVFGQVTAGQLISGLDKIYADYRNMRLDVLEVIPIAAQSTTGKTDAEITEMIEKARQRSQKKQ